MAGIKEGFAEIARGYRTPCIAQIGGFRPPEDPVTSWFARGVCLQDEQLPMFNGQPLFPLLQIRTSELPAIPAALAGIELLVVYLNPAEIPFDHPHADGWLVREYRSLEGLQPCAHRAPKGVKPMPIRWSLGDPERPGWEEASDLFDMSAISESESASERFFKLPHHRATKVGGYPTEVQAKVENAGDYVLQIGSEEKPNWIWSDNGVATFARDASGQWTFACQIY